MTISHLPAGPTDDVPYEPWDGEDEALAAATAAGRRAAEWIRSLPQAPAPGPVGTWLMRDLPETIETATASLDPQECDRMDPDGVMVDGTGGVDTVFCGLGGDLFDADPSDSTFGCETATPLP